MRQRLSSKFVNWVPVKGKDFYNEFFYNGKIKKEETIESIYNREHMRATSFNVEVTKESASRGITDGLIKAFVNEKDGRFVNFYGIQECKRDIRRGTKAYQEQIAQGLLYCVQFNKVKVLLLPSVNYIDFLFIDENKDAIDSNYLISLLREDSPCKAAKKAVLNIGKLKIHTLDMPTEADIEDMWKNIYKHCIEL